MSPAFLRHTAVGAALALCLLLAPPVADATTVRLQTSLGNIDVDLYDAAAPLTVANFLSYVRSGAYDNSFMHRSVAGFIIQGGGYTWSESTLSYSHITARPAVVNEFSACRSNLRGTIAMAKIAGNPDSATSEWFFNLGDNSGGLDGQNGGFTVFGRASADSLAVVDAIARLQTVIGGAFTTLPVTSLPTAGPLRAANLLMLSSVSVLSESTLTPDAEPIFDYLEHSYPQYLAPTPATSASASGYCYRYYAAKDAYIGTAASTVYYFGPASGSQLLPLGSVADWLGVARGAGY